MPWQATDCSLHKLKIMFFSLITCLTADTYCPSSAHTCTQCPYIQRHGNQCPPRDAAQ